MAKKKTRKKAGKKTAKKTARKSGGSLTALSTADLERELRRRQTEVNKLERVRASLVEKLETIERELASLGALGGVSIGGVKKRPKNDSNLADALGALLKNKTLSVTEAAEQVQKAGYRTSAENFRTIVNQTLLRDKRFKKISRGKYTSK